MKHLTKVETPKFKGYRFAIHRKGELIQEYFSVKRYGSLENALVAAQEYRDKIASEIFGADFQSRTKYSPHAQLSTANSSGHTGVCVQKTMRGVLVVASWRTWRDGKRYLVRKTFSVNKHGLDEATRLAVQIRNRALLDEEHLNG